MKYLIGREINLFFTSAMGYVIISVWLLATSLMLWVFTGEYNLTASGYATLRSFFILSPVLFFFIVPAITMRLFSEEKKTGTIELLLFRPVRLASIVLSKYLSACILMILALLPTIIYVFSINSMSNVGVDWGEVIGGYIGLLCLISVFSAIGLFTSSLTSNQLVAFILGILIIFLIFYGLDMLAMLFVSGSYSNCVMELGMNFHYRSLIRGMVDSRDLIYFFFLTTLFLFLTFYVCSRNKNKKSLIKGVLLLISIILLAFLSSFVYVRMDMTENKRYTTSSRTQQLIKQLDKPLEIVLYLNGDLNPAFNRLRTATIEMLEELSQFARNGIYVKQLNPAVAPDEMSRQKNYLRMNEEGMRGITVNERDKEGKLSSKVIFPWIELIYNGDTIPVGLLKKNINLTSQEILNTSIADLEYSLTESIRLLTMNEPERIAFIEGHGELTEPEVYEATELLSKYYAIDRGKISGNPEELFPYKVLIIAGPKIPFMEAEKFALDQYLMHGGRLILLIDGVQISQEQFGLTGESATIKNELNLDDLLFIWGVKINPVTVQDMNCTSIRVASSDKGVENAFAELPWYFAPLLEPEKTHPVTYNISPLKSEMVSSLTWVRVDSLKQSALLTTSDYSCTLPVPDMVSLRYVEMPAEPAYFNESDLLVGGLIEGSFPSAFRNRTVPKEASLSENQEKLQNGRSAKIFIAGTSSLIKNEWQGQGSKTQPLPLGFDSATGEQLGNADFIANLVNYLAGNEEWLSLRTKNNQLRLLDRQEITGNLLKWQLINTIFPLLLLFVVGGGYTLYHRKKYIS